MRNSILGLYAGIGGFELGFHDIGMQPSLLADKDDYCRLVLEKRFPRAKIHADVADLDKMPANTKIVTAGFPCQNLSMAGDKSGLSGSKSSDIRHLFELLRAGGRPTLVIENVYFMLHLGRGAAMKSLVGDLEELGYSWAYRVVNTTSFGLPQRRRRVFLVASTTIDPRGVLFADEAGPVAKPIPTLDQPIGFYWTEGRRGMGLAVDGIPPLKIASGIGIPSVPAVLFPDGEVLTPSIESCEELQGFPRGWTDVEFGVARSPRWSMVGNAVSVPAARWLASRIKEPGDMLPLGSRSLTATSKWPNAAFGNTDGHFAVDASERPLDVPVPSIGLFRDQSWKRLSERALRGYIGRAREGGLRFPAGFIEAVESALINR
ncbi:DNA (cytosine-5-)-methyltransferase [Sphingopyxis sp. OPL5]|jgi:DNA (cytosine-5)-methyltransferase 1|uniref:DNA cytosine methyltransferase n=1 Tax=Sphingopyxis sp. OPL5 TaxID=2486273 RepID=UPI00164E7A66|nr:DNA (cytosine-5-)-methyltransferase [Sphingopyxis sp. OPL5]QNO26381.1 DNA (cytosine-5-)-methyltransferase [Sphingopyxis sp. OPL5]